MSTQPPIPTLEMEEAASEAARLLLQIWAGQPQLDRDEEGQWERF